MDTKFDLTAFRQEFLINGEGWGVSDCYKPYDDKFLRRDAQDAYEGAKWAWQHQQAKVEELQKRVDLIREVLDELQEQADVIRKRGQKFRDSNYLASADMMDICIKEIEQALKGEG